MTAELWLEKRCEHNLINAHDYLFGVVGKVECPGGSRVRLDPVQVAEHVGDTFIDFRTMSPVLQWERIFRMLRDDPIGGIDALTEQKTDQ